MDTAALTTVVEKILAQGINLEPPPEWMHGQPEYHKLWQACHAGIPQTALAPLISLLAQQPDLQMFSTGATLHQGPASSTSISLTNLADWLVAEAHVNGTKITIETFSRFIHKNEAIVLNILGARGLSINEPIELTETLSIKPMRSLPASYGKVAAAHLLSSSDWSGQSKIPDDAAAIIFKDSAFSPVVTAFPSIRNPRDLTEVMAAMTAALEINRRQAIENESESTRRHNELEDVLRCLTLVGPCSPVAVGSWSQLVGPGVPITDGGGIGWNHETAFARPVKLGEFNPIEAQTVIKNFFKLLPSTQESLRVPLDRLNRAIRGTNPADRAIDLGVAFEAILFHGSGENGELSFRLSLRGAWMSGSNGHDRKENYHLLKKLYNLRSKAVHTGSLSATAAESDRQFLERGICLCSNILKLIIQGAVWPDISDKWDNLILDI